MYAILRSYPAKAPALIHVKASQSAPCGVSRRLFALGVRSIRQGRCSPTRRQSICLSAACAVCPHRWIAGLCAAHTSPDIQRDARGRSRTFQDARTEKVGATMRLTAATTGTARSAGSDRSSKKRGQCLSNDDPPTVALRLPRRASRCRISRTHRAHSAPHGESLVMTSPQVTRLLSCKVYANQMHEGLAALCMLL